MTKFSYEKSYKDKKIIKCRTQINNNKYIPMFMHKLTLADKNEIIGILEKKLKDYVDSRLNEILNNNSNISEPSDPLEEDIDEVQFDEFFGNSLLNNLNNEQAVRDLDNFYLKLEEEPIQETKPLLPLTQCFPIIGETTPLLGEAGEIFPILEEKMEESVEEYPEDFEENSEENSEDIYYNYEQIPLESDDEISFDIEAQQYLPLEDLSQSIIIDNDDFIIKEIKKEKEMKYDDLLNLDTLKNFATKDITNKKIEDITIRKFPPLPSSSDEEDVSRSRSISPSSITENEREKIINNLLNLDDFKQTIQEKREEDKPEVNELITTRNGLKIQKTQSGRFIITEILNSIEEIENNNDIDIFCDIEPTIDELSEQLSQLNLSEENKIMETFSGETLMAEYDELNNKKDAEYFESVTESNKKCEKNEEEKNEEEKKEIAELAFNTRQINLPVYNESELPPLEYYTEVYPKSGVTILEPIKETNLPVIKEKEVITKIAEQLVNEVIKEVVQKIADDDTISIRSDKTSYEEESEQEESIYNLVASRSLYYGDHFFPLIVTHNQNDGQKINYHKAVEVAKKVDNNTLYSLQVEEEEYFSSEFADDELVEEDSLSAVNNLLQSKINERVIQDYAMEIPEQQYKEIYEEQVSEESYVSSSEDEIQEQENWSFKKWFFGL
jgi:hypothetical protein